MREFDLPIGPETIRSILPHRYPFLLVDRVVSFEPQKSIVCLFNISNSNPILQGHFPDKPIFPGVLIVEGLAQASAIFGNMMIDYKPKQFLLTEITNTRFRKKVIPGDTLYYNVHLSKCRKSFFWFKGIAKVEGEDVASAEFSAFMH